jgi:RND family efflux transporter MFP subunit
MECTSTECNGAKNTPKRMILRVVISATVIVAGFIGMLAMASMKTPPAEVTSTEKAIFVETRKVVHETVPVMITGYGDVRPLEIVTLSSEVSGRVVRIHPMLREGEIIPAGDTLFKIDPRDYQASLDEATASVAQLETTLERLKLQKTTDEKRLKTLRRNRELAKAEFQRLKNLFETDKVGTRSGVEAAEQAANNATNQVDLLSQTVALYPIQIKEAVSSLAAAKARRLRAETQLARCTVTAPFSGRITQTALEKGQFVSPGTAAVTMANDATLEIHVPIDSRDARKWLTFDVPEKGGGSQWFSRPVQVPVTIRWTEDLEGHRWEGILHRVVAVDAKTRTVIVAVRVTDSEGTHDGVGHLPLVEGMFSIVEIPGRVLNGVVRLPRYAVTHENTVYAARGGRLKTLPVTVVRNQGEEAIISSGLAPGEEVIVTRLVEPMENALLKVIDHSES